MEYFHLIPSGMAGYIVVGFAWATTRWVDLVLVAARAAKKEIKRRAEEGQKAQESAEKAEEVRKTRGGSTSGEVYVPFKAPISLEPPSWSIWNFGWYMLIWPLDITFQILHNLKFPIQVAEWVWNTVTKKVWGYLLK